MQLGQTTGKTFAVYSKVIDKTNFNIDYKQFFKNIIYVIYFGSKELRNLKIEGYGNKAKID